MALDAVFVQKGSAFAQGSRQAPKDAFGEVSLDESLHAQAFVSPDERMIRSAVAGRGDSASDDGSSVTGSIGVSPEPAQDPRQKRPGSQQAPSRPTANRGQSPVPAASRWSQRCDSSAARGPTVTADGRMVSRRSSEGPMPVPSSRGAALPGARAKVDDFFVQAGSQDLFQHGSTESLERADSKPSRGRAGTPPRSAAAVRKGSSGGLIDALFVHPMAKESMLVTAARAGDEDAITLEEIAAAEVKAANATEQELPARQGCGCMPEVLSLECAPPELQPRELASRAALAFILLLLVGLVTASLAMGCEDEAPLGEFCVSEGAVQWIVATAPSLLLLSGLAYWAYRKHLVRRKGKESSWAHDGEAQRDAMGVLETLLQVPAEDRLRYTRQVLTILKDFPDKATIQHKGCLALEAIARAQKGNSTKVQMAGAVPVLLAALELHLRVREVQRAGLGAVACLAKVADQQLFVEGGIPVILASMAKFKRDPAVQLPGALAIGGLCCARPKNRKSVCKFGGITILLSALERHVDRPDVMVAASEALTIINDKAAVLREHLQPYAEVVNGIVAHVEGQQLEATREIIKTNGSKVADKHSKRAKELQVVLKSLHKLQGELKKLESGPPPPQDMQEFGSEEEDTPRGGAAPEVAATGSGANELQDRLQAWNTKRNKGR